MKPIRCLATLLIAAWLQLFSATTLLAHHGAADYEKDQVVTIRGTVVSYELVNPHMQIVVHGGPEGSKEAVDWKVESVALNMMVRMGFKADTLKTGDMVTVTGRAGKNGKPMMLLVKLVLPDGHELDAPYQ